MSPFIRILLEHLLSMARQFDYAVRTIHRCFPLTLPPFKLLSVILCASLAVEIIQAQVTLTVSKGGAGHEADVELSWSPPIVQDVLVYSIGRPFDLLSGAVSPVHYHAGVLNDETAYAYEVRDPGSSLLPGELYSSDSIIGSLQYVPASIPWGFHQGSPADEPCRADEEDRFTHITTRDVAVMKTEVTRRMWEELKSAQPTLPEDPTFPQFSSDYPVMNVTWYEAMLFANLLSLENGLIPCYYRDAGFTIPVDSKNYESDEIFCDFNSNGYRFLTEGEWEYSDRAGTDGPFFCSEGNYSTSSCTDCAKGLLPVLEQHMVFCGDSSGPEPAEGKLANPWGLHNMNGNVREWCWDWCDTYPTSGTDYAGPECGTHRVERGSMFVYMPRNMRCSMRGGFEPDTLGQYLGFRLARTVD